MENTDILIAILSFGMSVVLIMFIVALIYLVKILKHIKSITEKTEHIAGNVDAASEFFKKTAGPAAAGKMLVNIFEAVRNHERKK